MKYFLLMFLSLNAMAIESIHIDVVDEVRTLRHDPITQQVQVTLWSNKNVYQMDESHAAVPCLEESFKNKIPVALQFEENDKIIAKCRLINIEQN